MQPRERTHGRSLKRHPEKVYRAVCRSDSLKYIKETEARLQSHTVGRPNYSRNIQSECSRGKEHTLLNASREIIRPPLVIFPRGVLSSISCGHCVTISIKVLPVESVHLGCM